MPEGHVGIAADDIRWQAASARVEGSLTAAGVLTSPWGQEVQGQGNSL